MHNRANPATPARLSHRLQAAAAILAAVTVGIPAAIEVRGLQQSSADAALTALVQEFVARAEAGPLETGQEGPLVRDRMRLLSESAALEHARWAKEFLARVEAVKPDALSDDEAITLAILRWEAGIASERGEFYWYDMPVTPYSSPLRAIQARFTGAPLSTVEDRQRYLDGLHQLSVVVSSMEAKLRGQADRRIVLPAPELDLVVPYVRSFAGEGDRSPFVPSAARLDAIDAGTRTSFGEAVVRTVAEELNPAVVRLATYIDGPYRSGAASEVGIGRYPGGDRCYRLLVRMHTGVELTPEAIHQIGLDEIARLETELDNVRREAQFTGTLAEFRTFLKTDRRFIPTEAGQIGDALMAAAARIEPGLDKWFSRRPKAAYGARRLAPALEPSMTYGFYQVPTRQDPKGYYLFNGSRLEQRSLLNAAALSYHELVPGHHFQINLARENDTLPVFRRNALYTAFTEGWGEYASDLADEMGMYDKPYDRAGRLAMDLFLSTRLVVDTGMNALGWNRERAMDYMRAHTLDSEAQIATETLRYSTDMPGQALAYKMGSRTIRDLRERMRARLGAKFDVRRFHDAVLGHGAMPLSVLEQHLERTLVRK
jgi:uncharacterized protein (DUF885 family)